MANDLEQAQLLRAQALRRLAQQQSGVGGGIRQLPPQNDGLPDGYELIGRFEDNGRVYRKPDGTLGATSAGMSTSDPAAIQKIMEGGTYADAFQDRLDEERIAQNPIAARASEFVRGVPFVGSYTDEVVGMVSPQARDNMRATTEAMQRQRPGQTTALNLGGAVAGSIPMAMAAAPSVVAAAPATRGAQAVAGLTAGAVAGGTEGAIYGAGEGRTGAERVQQAQTQGAIGAGMGGALGVAAPYLGAALKSTISRLQNSDVAVIASELGISRPAARVIRDALDAGGVEDAVARIQRGGDGAMLADAGTSASTLLDATIASGGRPAQTARAAISERTLAESERLTGVLDDVLGLPRGEAELMREIRMNSAPARAAAYEAAYSKPINYASESGRQLEQEFRKIPPAAWRRADELMRLDGDESLQRLVQVEGNRVTMTELPDVRTLDYVTRALNDVAAEADGKGALGGTTQLGRSTATLSRTIRNLVSESVPEYREALDVAADAISQRQAVDLGYDAISARVRREDIAEALSGASRAEREAMRQGIRSYLDETMGRVQRTITEPTTETREAMQALRLLSSRNNQQKLRMILGSDANRLLEEIDRTATAFELRAAVAENSRTAVRQSVQGGVNEISQGGPVRTLMRGEPVDAAKRLTQGMTGEDAAAQELRRMGLYEDVARALTGVRGERAERAMRIISGAMDRQDLVSENQAKMIANVLTAGGLSASHGTAQALSRPGHVQ